MALARAAPASAALQRERLRRSPAPRRADGVAASRFSAVLGYLKRLVTTGAAYQFGDILAKGLALITLPLYTRHVSAGGLRRRRTRC